MAGRAAANEEMRVRIIEGKAADRSSGNTSILT